MRTRFDPGSLDCRNWQDAFGDGLEMVCSTTSALRTHDPLHHDLTDLLPPGRGGDRDCYGQREQAALVGRTISLPQGTDVGC